MDRPNKSNISSLPPDSVAKLRKLISESGMVSVSRGTELVPVIQNIEENQAILLHHSIIPVRNSGKIRVMVELAG